MTQLRVACIQLRSGVEVAPNIEATSALVREAAGQGAQLVATPEMTNLLDIRPGMARPKIVAEADDQALAALRALAAELGIWLLIGSLAVTLEGEDRLANRSFLIASDGSIRARYDKIHMFDVDVTPEETFRESDGYRPGDQAVVAVKLSQSGSCQR